MNRLPVYFVSHGGGPWPWMKSQTGSLYNQLEASLHGIADELKPVPKAVLMISGHWEESVFSISSAAQPRMIYDYSGFPPETYEIEYPAPGMPHLAEQVGDLLSDNGIDVALDPQRGYDHGTFTVMAPMYPQAEVPVVQVSLRTDYDPEAHLQVGHALASLRSEDVAIIGSGLSYHNLQQFRSGGQKASSEFDAWLQSILIDTDPHHRWDQLVEWTRAPSARQAHPEPDHLLPLMVATGAAQSDRAKCIYHEDAFFNNITVSSFRFGAVNSATVSTS